MMYTWVPPRDSGGWTEVARAALHPTAAGGGDGGGAVGML